MIISFKLDSTTIKSTDTILLQFQNRLVQLGEQEISKEDTEELKRLNDLIKNYLMEAVASAS